MVFTENQNFYITIIHTQIKKITEYFNKIKIIKKKTNPLSQTW